MERQQQLNQRYGDFLERAAKTYSEHSVGMIRDALAFADEKLAGLVRYNGTPLLDHSVGTASIVISEIGLGRNSVISTLLHDVVRLGLATSAQLGERFGAECTAIIDGTIIICLDSL